MLKNILFPIALLICSTSAATAMETKPDNVTGNKLCHLPVKPAVFVTRSDLKKYLIDYRAYMKCISGSK